MELVFEEIEKILLYVNGVMAYLANFMLIYFILKHSRKQLGTYRYLMLLFGVFNMIFPGIHLLVMPRFHIHDYAFIKFPTGFLVGTLEPAHWGLVIHGCFFIQFRNHLLYIFNSRQYIPIHMLIWLTMAVIWGTNCKNLMWYSAEFKEYVGEDLAETYGFDVNKTGFLGLMYKHKKVNGIEAWNYTALLCGAICMLQISTTFSIISFCGFRILTTLKSAAMSEKARKLQIELFKALLIQTFVPLMLEYMPSSVIFLGPLVRLPLGRLSNYLSFGISFYPFIDPLCILYFIRDYRNAIKRIIRRRQVGYVTETSQSVKLSNETKYVHTIQLPENQEQTSETTRRTSAVEGEIDLI